MPSICANMTVLMTSAGKRAELHHAPPMPRVLMTPLLEELRGVGGLGSLASRALEDESQKKDGGNDGHKRHRLHLHLGCW